MSAKKVLRIGTRQSPLAIAQTHEVIECLSESVPDFLSEYEVDIIPLKTTGDNLIEHNLSEIGGKGLFTKEIEEALLNNQIDLAVHSMKDVPAVETKGLIISCTLKREDPRDALIANVKSIKELPYGATIGTSSTRRAAQLKHLRPDLKIVPFRGNVQTRLEKLKKGIADATILAVAGLLRLNYEDKISTIISTNEMLPAIAQGAIGIQHRESDNECKNLLALINHDETFKCIQAERIILKAFGGSCKTSMAALACISNETDQIEIEGFVSSLDGTVAIRAHASGHANNHFMVAETVIEDLIKQGAKSILNLP